VSKLESSEKIAQRLSLTARRVRQLAEEGVIPAADITPGGHRRFDPEAVALALEMRKRYTFVEGPEGLSEPLLAAEAGARLVRRHGRRGAITAAMIADARPSSAGSIVSIPFIGEPGSSRFVADRGAAV
jgi:excisionase family DNA binding protein